MCEKDIFKHFFLEMNLRFETATDLQNALSGSNCQFLLTLAHLFLSYHLTCLPWFTPGAAALRIQKPDPEPYYRHNGIPNRAMDPDPFFLRNWIRNDGHLRPKKEEIFI